jgi:membrane protease YdiL (CAAX protease family)
VRSIELRKLIYVLTALVVVTNGFALFMVWFFIRELQFPISFFSTGEIPAGIYLQFMPPLFVFIELLVMIWIYWPFEPQPEPTAGPQNRNFLRLILVGAGAGLGLFIVFVPLLLRTRPDVGLVSLILDYSRSSPTYVAVGLIGIALPLVAETVFKRIVLKTLLKHMPFLWSLLITSVAFALVWPVFHGYWLALGLGAVTGMLYYRYCFMTPPIIAHITFTSAVFGFLALRVLGH